MEKLVKVLNQYISLNNYLNKGLDWIKANLIIAIIIVAIFGLAGWLLVLTKKQKSRNKRKK